MIINNDELLRIKEVFDEIFSKKEFNQLYDKDKLVNEYILFIRGLYPSLINNKILEKQNRKSLFLITVCSFYFMTIAYNMKGHVTLTDEKVEDGEAISMLSLQIVNYVKSILINESIALEAPSRIVFRSLVELCWTLNTITYDVEKRDIYVREKSKNQYENGKVWSKNFSPKELKKCINQIEKKMNNDEEYLTYMKKFRNGMYSSYSEFAHNDFEMLLNTTFYHKMDRDDYVFNIGELVALSDEKLNWRSQVLDDLAQLLILTVLYQQYIISSINKLIHVSDVNNTWAIYQAVTPKFVKDELLHLIKEIEGIE